MRFIVATNSVGATAAAKNELTRYLEGRGWSVWHWFEDLWLIDEASDETELKEVRIEIMEAVPSIGMVLVLSTEGHINHSGRVPKSSVDWFQKHWLRRSKE